MVLEAMKMEQPLVAHKTGVLSGLVSAVGQSVTSGPGDQQLRGEDPCEWVDGRSG
ncbi:biotin/lipoyl-containing protein [Microbispora sp. CA-135349]|uniref:biotin/lipoyl-containing protein n=1 Tax=Microbispora sp. CA-135349 TaxID=3239953 RepID=UPI003D8F63D1